MVQLNALVVDDSASMRRQLCHALGRMEGLVTTEARDGADAWRKLATARFDVLITDINMPVLDGLKLVALVRQGGAHAAIPIVVITTEAGEADRRRAMALGADAFLVKPVQAQQVVELVRGLVQVA
jgi:two-component system, chemotaxis family, chemotaxis protein CheY